MRPATRRYRGDECRIRRQCPSLRGHCRPGENHRHGQRVAAATPRHVAQLRGEFAPDELASTLAITRHNADNRLDLALDLTGRLPGTLAALQHGEIDLRKAGVIADLTHVLPVELAQQVEAHVLRRAGRQTPPILRQAIRRAITRLDPHGAGERHEQRSRERRVDLRADEDATAWFIAYLPYEQAAAIYERLDRLAREAKTEGDERSADQRRADAFVDLILNPTGDTTPRYEVRVTVAAGTLLGLDDLPGELAGYGAVPAEVARRIAGDATWQRRLLTDPESGTLLDYGTTVYRPPAGLDNHVRTRDKTCRFPGCRQPARKCDLDHRLPFPDGPTSDKNLNALCRRHHRLKGVSEWDLESDGSGGLIWASPAGFKIDVPAEPVL